MSSREFTFTVSRDEFENITDALLDTAAMLRADATKRLDLYNKLWSELNEKIRGESHE